MAWNSLEAGEEGEGVGWDPLEARPLAGKPSGVLTGPSTEVCWELVAWEPMNVLWQQMTLAGSPTAEQAQDSVLDLALDLVWDSPGPLTKEQGQAPCGPLTEDH